MKKLKVITSEEIEANISKCPPLKGVFQFRKVSEYRGRRYMTCIHYKNRWYYSLDITDKFDPKDLVVNQIIGVEYKVCPMSREPYESVKLYAFNYRLEEDNSSVKDCTNVITAKYITHTKASNSKFCDAIFETEEGLQLPVRVWYKEMVTCLSKMKMGETYDITIDLDHSDVFIDEESENGLTHWALNNEDTARSFDILRLVDVFIEPS